MTLKEELDEITREALRKLKKKERICNKINEEYEESLDLEARKLADAIDESVYQEIVMDNASGRTKLAKTVSKR